MSLEICRSEFLLGPAIFLNFLFKKKKMKRIFLFLTIMIFFFSCKKESVETNNNSELWLKVDNSIGSLNVSFVGTNAKNEQHSYVVYYKNGIFSSTIKQAKDKDGKDWVLVNSSSEKCAEIVVTCKDNDNNKDKEHKTRGFNPGEKRFIEVVLALDGSFNVIDYDITMIDKTIFVN